MQVVNLSTGCLLSSIGLITTTYFLYFSKKFRQQKSTHLLTSQSISTILIGLFYIYASTTTSSLFVQIDTIKINDLEHYDLIENSNSTITNQNGNYRLLQHTNPGNNQSDATMCILKTAYLKEALLAYSFIQGLVSLMAVAFDCKECVKKATETKSELEETPNTSFAREEKPKIKPDMKQLSLALVLLLSPIVCLTSLYFIMQTNSSVIASNAPMIPLPIDNIRRLQTNISVPTNESQVDEVIKNIYRILSLNTSEVPRFKLHDPPQTVVACNDTSVWKKVFAFIIYVIGVFSALIYSQMVYLKTKTMKENSLTIDNFKKALVGFSLMWLPNALDMLVRTHLAYEQPELVSEGFLALGNAYNVLMNVSNVLTTRKIVQQQNNVEPK